MLLSLLIGVIAVVAFYLGVDYFARILLERAWEEPIFHVLLGVSLIVLVALGTLQVYRRRHLPEATPLAVVAWGVFALFMISMAVIALASAFTTRTGTRGF